MFGIDSPELLVIAIVALVVIGPKELPGMLRSWGKWMAKMRGMAAEFRGHVDEMVRQSELDEVKKQLTDATSGIGLQDLDPTRQIKSMIQDGMAEGGKTLADVKDTLNDPLALAEPDSAPQIAAEADEAAEVPTPESMPEPVPAPAAVTAEAAAESPAAPEATQPAVEEKPAKIAAAG